MTLLVSQVEALKGDMEFPFIHEFEDSLHYGEIVKQVLVTNNTDFTSDIYAQDGKAKEKLTITFRDEFDIIAYLTFEQRFVTAELVRGHLSNLPKKRRFRKAVAMGEPEMNAERLNSSYSAVITLLLARAEKVEAEIQETVTL